MFSHGLHLLGCLWTLYWRRDVIIRGIALKLLHLSSRSEAWWVILSLELLCFLFLLKSILLLYREGFMLEWIVSQLATRSICTCRFIVLDIVLMIDLAIAHNSWLLGRLSPLLFLAS